jgi:AcrR family transcriptional regulator
LESAALELVAERGAHGFTLAEASRRAGVSAAAPFRHFANRDALLAALVLKGYAAQARRFAAAIAADNDPVEQLGEFAGAYVQFAIDERALFEITFAAGLDKTLYPELEKAGRQVLDVLLTPAMALRPSRASALELVHAVAAVAHGYAAFLREGVLGAGAGAAGRATSQARAAARVLAERPGLTV